MSGLLYNIRQALLPFLESDDQRVWAAGILLMAANLVPLVGLLFLKWEPARILLLYCAEVFLFGLFLGLGYLLAGLSRRHEGFGPVVGLLYLPATLLAVAVIMGILGWGLYEFLLQDMPVGAVSTQGGGEDLPMFMKPLTRGALEEGGESPLQLLWAIFGRDGVLALAALFVSHLSTFLMFFVGDHHYRRLHPDSYQDRLEHRLLHVLLITLVVGIVLTATHSHGLLPVLWVLLKLFLDLHAQNHQLRMTLLEIGA